ncbi:tumor necrosis factor receptor superfamily member 10D-like isoform X2 [Bos indicus x Bos taurus]|uniref:tumor necrosis factor receptor superfamily member 10D-like isoform X2 n=1 Tax=Bos indicus x Bos taurus TaxID=30522 RepID=UPI000F7D4B32|nr:tumor necrosis factor receptor superfamily member 10D-like isoform X2 [Bos indicus x Bos taurus]
MTVPTISLRGPRQRTLPDRKGQRGRRAPASSSAGAGRSGGPKLRFGYLVFVMGVVLWDLPGTQILSLSGQMTTEHVGGALSPPPKGTDLPGTEGKTMSHGEEEKNCCTLINDTECRCKSGTFHGEDAPEFCQKYSTGCPDGKDMDMNSTLRSNIKGMDQESGTLAHGEAPVPGELATMSQRLPMTPSPSSGPSSLMIGIVTGIVITVFLIGCVVCYLKGPFNECWHKVIGFSSIWRPQTLEKEADRRQRPVPRCSKQTVCC